MLKTFGNNKAPYLLFTVGSQAEFSGRNEESTIHDFLFVSAFWEGGFQAFPNIREHNFIGLLLIKQEPFFSSNMQLSL